MNARQLALSVLEKCRAAEQYSNLALDTALSRNPLSDADKGLLTALVYGVLERRLTLDACIEALTDRPLDEIDLRTQTLLHLGLYQLIYLDRVPDHAAVNETVALAPRRTRGLINAVLRAFLRGGKTIPVPDAAKEPVRYLSVKYSFAPAICTLFLEQFGFARTESLLEAFCKQPPVTLRVNPLSTSRKELLSRLEAAGYDARPTPQSVSGICLSGGAPTSLPGFFEGDFFVQDEASQLCVEAVEAAAGMTVIDTCACPGSKSFGMAMEMQNTGSVFSCDLHANKLSLVQSGASRLGISILECHARDAREENSAWLGIADRVLCDVPCSGFGVFAKKPELRYKDPNMSAALPAIQRAILETSCRYVKDGGRLIYSTCTLLSRENEETVRAFLGEHTEFRLVRERTLYPDLDGTDGFYFAVLEKRPS